MSNLDELKLKNVELSDEVSLMSYSSGYGGSSGFYGGSLDEVVVYGSYGCGSGSGIPIFTCSWCGTKYDDWGMCPNCDNGSGASGFPSFVTGSGSGLFKWTPVDVEQIKLNACINKRGGDKCYVDYGKNGAAYGKCVGSGSLECELSVKLEKCLMKNEGDDCRYLNDYLQPRDGKCIVMSRLADPATTLLLHCSTLN